METGIKPITSGEEGLRVLQILEISQNSIEQKQFTPSGLTPLSSHDVDPSTPDLSYFAHETAVIDEECEIGSGTKIWHFSHVLSRSKIGKNCNIGQNVAIGPDVAIGKGCKIQNNVSVFKGVTLEDGVFCGPSMVFTNVYNPRAELRKMDQVRPTLVKKGVTIGANATIVCGVTLGRYSFIGAGSVVTKDIDDYALVMGNHAQQVGYMCECGERIDENLSCLVCGKKYERNNNALRLLASD